MRALLALSAAVILGASSCSTNPGTIDLTGNWNYSATQQDTALSLNCTTTGGTMQLTQSGPQVNGTYSGLTFACTGALTQSFGPYSGTIVSGTITGTTVIISFNVTGCCGAGSSWQNTGSASSSNAMQGSILTVITLDGTQYTMFGTWNATKQ
jgi:hypothetical protein